MIKRSESFLKQIVGLLDAVVLIAAFFAAYEVRQSVSLFTRWDLIPAPPVLGELKSLDRYLALLLVIVPLWIGMLYMMGGYRKLRMKSIQQIAWIIAKASVFGLLFFGSAVFLFKLHYVSRSFMVVFFLLSTGGLVLERLALIMGFHLMLHRGYFHRNLLIVGSGPRARTFIKSVQSHADWGLRVVGVLDEPVKPGAARIPKVRWLGRLSELPTVLREEVVDEVIFVLPRSWMPQIEPAILDCERLGIRATVAVDLFNTRIARASSSEFDGRPLISFDTTPVDPWRLAMKRLMDVAVASVGLMLLAPAFPIIAFLIRLTSPGPVFFRQTRCGLNGRRFTLYKFRSMVADAEAKQANLAHLNELNGPVFKATNDPRLTPVGKWLRMTSIDELPQLLNVLKGEMSLVGPRPPLPSEVAHYKPWQRRRLSMRPGVTGAWQVNGRNRLKDFNEWMRMDLGYIDRWSLWLDTKILLKTVPAVLTGNGAK